MRFGTAANHPVIQHRRGKVLMFDFRYPNTGAIEVHIQGNFDIDSFNPHGISIWEDEQTGALFLLSILIT